MAGVRFGDYENMLKHNQIAIDLEPDFVGAMVNLGTQALHFDAFSH
jgi:hypothetical protein